MSATTTPTCALGLTPDDLSAWRDHALDSAGERRITAHAASCAACQHTIAMHDALAAGLRADEPPAPDPRNFARLQTRIASGATASRALSRASWSPRWRRAALWSGLSAVAAALVITTLFFSLFSQRMAQRHVNTGPLATPAPVATLATTRPVMGAPLHWQTYTAPSTAVPPLGNQSLLNGFAFAPSDSLTAYICAVQNTSASNPIAIWATHNGAQSWTQVATLPNSFPLSECDITVDALNPSRLDLFIAGQDMTTLKDVARGYLSDDGGQTWRQLSDDVELTGIVTRGQASVAVASPWYTPTNLSGQIPPAGRPRLVVSHDGFHSWMPIDGALFAQNLVVMNVWQRPGDGALLAMTEVRTLKTAPGGFPIIDFALWQSSDMGAHWSAFNTPANLNGLPGFVVAPPLGSDPWRVCGLTVINGGTPQLNELIACTLDGGKTWTPRPLPNLRAMCSSLCDQEKALSSPALLLPNGTLVTTFYTDDRPGGAKQGAPSNKVFVLPANSSQWQDLGAPPGGALLAISPTHNSTTLVTYAGGSYPNNAYAGELVGQIGGPVAYRGDLSFATLP